MHAPIKNAGTNQRGWAKEGKIKVPPFNPMKGISEIRNFAPSLQAPPDSNTASPDSRSFASIRG